VKIVQVPFCYAPDPIGGTEVYVTNVAQNLSAMGVDIVIAAPGRATYDYEREGLRVRRFAVSQALDLKQLYGAGDAFAADEFAKILRDEAPDLVHLHALAPAVSLRLIRSIKANHIPVVFTYHTATVTCQRGTLMRWGAEICDGVLEVSRCAACTLHGAGLPRLLAQQIVRLPPEFGRRLDKLRLRGGVWTALRMSELVDIRHTTFRELATEIDHFVAVCDWVRDVLQANGVPDEKIVVSRQGISWSQTDPELPSAGRGGAGWTQFAFVGRLDPTKGLHVLIDAFLRNPALNMKLDIFGIVQSAANADYQLNLLRLAQDDPRIAFHEALPPRNVVSVMRRYDFVAIPSQSVETGPMVVLEAFAAGVPVVSENHSGMAEIVKHGVDGFLIERDAKSGWADALRQLTLDQELRDRLRAGVRAPRTSREAAEDMLTLYRSLLRIERNARP
jgi:glycosyltransferase involved in cell wall biosynthesis